MINCLRHLRHLRYMRKFVLVKLLYSCFNNFVSKNKMYLSAFRATIPNSFDTPKYVFQLKDFGNFS